MNEKKAREAAFDFAQAYDDRNATIKRSKTKNEYLAAVYRTEEPSVGQTWAHFPFDGWAEEKHLCRRMGCENEIEEPKMCCSGFECGCMGQPIDPPYCSKECMDKAFGRDKK